MCADSRDWEQFAREPPLIEQEHLERSTRTPVTHYFLCYASGTLGMGSRRNTEKRIKTRISGAVYIDLLPLTICARCGDLIRGGHGSCE